MNTLESSQKWHFQIPESEIASKIQPFTSKSNVIFSSSIFRESYYYYYFWTKH